MLDELQRLLDRVNERFGSAGSVLTVVFWLVVLFFALKSMLLDF